MVGPFCIGSSSSNNCRWKWNCWLASLHPKLMPHLLLEPLAVGCCCAGRLLRLAQAVTCRRQLRLQPLHLQSNNNSNVC